jgi:uncharacterized pyridoxamine 5'-phosphate oxidase family protein
MAGIGYALMNSKGQSVISTSRRNYFIIGEKFYILINNNRYVLKKMKGNKRFGKFEFCLKD